MFCFSNDVSIETSMTTTGDALRLLVIARFQLMVNGERGRGTTTTKSTWMKHNQPFWQNGHVNGKQKATVTQRMRSPLHSVISWTLTWITYERDMILKHIKSDATLNSGSGRYFLRCILYHFFYFSTSWLVTLKAAIKKWNAEQEIERGRISINLPKQ